MDQSKESSKQDKEDDNIQSNIQRSVENILAWLKNTGQQAESKVRSIIEDCLEDHSKVEKDNFSKANYPYLQRAYEDIVIGGLNTVDNIVAWLKDANVVQKETEDDIRKLFADVTDQSNVQFEKFKTVTRQLSEQKQHAVDDLVTAVSTQAPRLVQAIQAAATSLQEAMKKDP